MYRESQLSLALIRFRGQSHCPETKKDSIVRRKSREAERMYRKLVSNFMEFTVYEGATKTLC